MIFASRARLQSVFLCLLVLVGGSSCVELNIIVPNGKKDASHPRDPFLPLGEIEVHTAADIPLEPVDVEEILAGANTLASVSSDIGDTKCSLNFKIKPGGIPKFDEPQIIRDRHDLNELNNNYNGMKVVKGIWWCNQFWPDILGCQKDDGIVVIRPDTSQEEILWLHEYGHLRGLIHRNQPNAIMNEFIGPTNKYLTPDECARYR